MRFQVFGVVRFQGFDFSTFIETTILRFSGSRFSRYLGFEVSRNQRNRVVWFLVFK
jgi:hypothetical protein